VVGLLLLPLGAHRPLDLLLVAVEAEGVHTDLKPT